MGLGTRLVDMYIPAESISHIHGVMDSARPFLCPLLTVFWFIAPNCSPQRPTTGVLLYLENERDSNNGRMLPNNSLISTGSLSSDYGLACFSADASSNTIGEWRFPDGSGVDRDINDQQQLVLAHNQIGRVTLQIKDNRPFPSALEGVYSCRIPDETGIMRTLYAGVYSTTSYDNSAGPIVSSPVEFCLLSHAYGYPPTFSVACISTAFPPTTLEWRLDGRPLDLSSNSFSSSQQLREITSSTYYNMLTVSGASVGQYSCSVANDRGTNSANMTVNAPSGAPAITDVSSVGNNSVRVQWSPPVAGIVRGYRVFYTDGLTTNILNISNALATETVVRGLTLGVQYSITVQAFADFPSPNSTADTIMLNAPSTPQNVTVTTLSSSLLVVRWSFPSNGIDGYEVSYTPVVACDGISGGAEMVEGANTFTHILQNLQAYTEYSITVRARGADGLGPLSIDERQRTAADAPGPPQMVVVANGSSSSGISVRWNEPDCSDINDAQVTGYMISYGILSEAQRTTISHSGTTFTISGDGLQLFTEHSIQVAAVNSRGVGTYSQPKIGVITRDLYSAPMLNGGNNTSTVIAGTIVGVLLLLILLVVIIIVSSIILYSRSKSRHPKEGIEMMKCEAYEAVKISSNISQAEGDYATVIS